MGVDREDGPDELSENRTYLGSRSRRSNKLCCTLSRGRCCTHTRPNFPRIRHTRQADDKLWSLHVQPQSSGVCIRRGHEGPCACSGRRRAAVKAAVRKFRCLLRGDVGRRITWPMHRGASTSHGRDNALVASTSYHYHCISLLTGPL